MVLAQIQALAVTVTDIRTTSHKGNSMLWMLNVIHDGEQVRMPEKEIARVRDFTDEGLIPYGAQGAVPPRTSEEAPHSHANGFKVSQATAQLYMDRMGKYSA